jgi:predicted dehydrogenase
MDNLRVAVVGLGKMGLLHASILNMMPNVEVVALCDKSSLLLKFVKKLFRGSQTVKNVEQLSDFDVDCVYVTTPIPAHYPVISSLYSNSITSNLFVEKTLADSWDKAKALTELAETCGGVNMVGYMRRFAVTFQKAKNLLDRGTIGEIVSFDACAYSSDFVDIKRGSKGSGSRGGVLNDLGSHVIDLVSFFFGDFELSSAMVEPLAWMTIKLNLCLKARQKSGIDMTLMTTSILCLEYPNFIVKTNILLIPFCPATKQNLVF